MLITLLREMARRWPSDDDEGATAVEYALLVGLIAVIIISSVTLLGGNIDAMFDDVANQLGGGSDSGS
ncbi:Flp family type IVb pilin [Winogradskya consettensis]|uniref:Pilus assembly protein n=2 Tax=Winogradskya TaxID=3240235 RepID=A0A919VQ75_9ACTN|nr:MULTISPECIES: Flp family type IVb pilin [Actinoplanes]GIE25300.1 pilus assembly protein [Actinoplanes humidus]GIM71877.1 pilus assembly protein [Actinoplanes consettensis]